jgi:hypothetical protein
MPPRCRQYLRRNRRCLRDGTSLWAVGILARLRQCPHCRVIASFRYVRWFSRGLWQLIYLVLAPFVSHRTSHSIKGSRRPQRWQSVLSTIVFGSKWLDAWTLYQLEGLALNYHCRELLHLPSGLLNSGLHENDFGSSESSARLGAISKVIWRRPIHAS